MGFNGSSAQSRSSCLYALLQAFKLRNAGHAPLLMVLLQLSDRRLLEQLVHRALPDGLHVTLVLEVNGGEGCPERLQERLNLEWMPIGNAISHGHRMMCRVGRHVLPPDVLGHQRRPLLAPVGTPRLGGTSAREGVSA